MKFKEITNSKIIDFRRPSISLSLELSPLLTARSLLRALLFTAICLMVTTFSNKIRANGKHGVRTWCRNSTAIQTGDSCTLNVIEQNHGLFLIVYDSVNIKYQKVFLKQLNTVTVPRTTAAVFGVQYLFFSFWQQIATHRSKVKVTVNQTEQSVTANKKTAWILHTGMDHRK